VPTKVAGALTQRLGISLAGEGADAGGDEAKNRRTAIGSLMGYVTGIGVGALYGTLRPHLGRVSPLLAGAAVGLAAMAASDTPAVTTGATDVKTGAPRAGSPTCSPTSPTAW
jgi:hypothetical protein